MTNEMFRIIKIQSEQLDSASYRLVADKNYRYLIYFISQALSSDGDMFRWLGVLSEKRQAAKQIRYGMENTALVNQLVVYVMEAVKFKAQFLGIEEVPEGMCGRREDSEEG